MKEKMLAEALERMKILGLEGPVTEQLKKSGTVFYSERTPLGGILYWVDNEERYAAAVKEFEKNTGCFAYHCTHEYMEYGECLSILYVSEYEDEWEMDRELLKEGNTSKGFTQYAYVVNFDEPLFSEFGTVTVSNVSGGLIRVE